MKNLAMFAVLAGLILLVCSGCATYLPAGSFYTGAKGAIGAGAGDVSHSKVGISQSTSILGLVATGDSSIKTAAANGGIKKIKYVDYEVENILGLYGVYKTVVYGD
jgi:hypothetical protein